jgi:GntR family transcriptional regulator
LKFHNDRPIFLQIVADIEDQILSGRLQPEARAPAIRDYAITAEVNPNTVVRSFEILEDSGVIFKKRGLGYFVSPNAQDIIRNRHRDHFIEKQLPETIRKMNLLEIPLEKFLEIYQQETCAPTPAITNLKKELSK